MPQESYVKTHFVTITHFVILIIKCDIITKRVFMSTHFVITHFVIIITKWVDIITRFVIKSQIVMIFSMWSITPCHRGRFRLLANSVNSARENFREWAGGVNNGWKVGSTVLFAFWTILKKIPKIGQCHASTHWFLYTKTCLLTSKMPFSIRENFFPVKQRRIIFFWVYAFSIISFNTKRIITSIYVVLYNKCICFTIK